MENSDQGTAHADNAAKVVGSIIIAGIPAVFSYGFLHGIIFE